MPTKGLPQPWRHPGRRANLKVKHKIVEALSSAKSGLSFREIMEKVSADKSAVSRNLRELIREQRVACQWKIPSGPNAAPARLQKIFTYISAEQDTFNVTAYQILRTFLPLEKEPISQAEGLPSVEAVATSMSIGSMARELKKRYEVSIRPRELKPLVLELLKEGFLRPVRRGTRQAKSLITAHAHYRTASFGIPMPVRIPRQLLTENYQLTGRGFGAAFMSAVKVKEEFSWRRAAFLYKEKFAIFRWWDLFVNHGVEEEMIERITMLVDDKSNFHNYDPLHMDFQIDPGISMRELLFPTNRQEVEGYPGIRLDFSWILGRTFLRKWMALLKSDRKLRSDAQKVVQARYNHYKGLADDWKKVGRELSEIA